ncbi:hypothetical protein ACFL1V_09495, partial [Pseudomonadota bacterium]
ITVKFGGPLSFDLHLTAWLIGGESAFALEMIFVFFISLLLLIVATLMFKVVMPHLIERLS